MVHGLHDRWPGHGHPPVSRYDHRLPAIGHGHALGIQGHHCLQIVLCVVVHHRTQHRLIPDHHEARSQRADQHVQRSDYVYSFLAHLRLSGHRLSGHAPGGEVVGQVNLHAGPAGLIGAHRRGPEGSIGELCAHHWLTRTTASALAFLAYFEVVAIHRHDQRARRGQAQTALTVEHIHDVARVGPNQRFHGQVHELQRELGLDPIPLIVERLYLIDSLVARFVGV